jgi:hypothetical protein
MKTLTEDLGGYSRELSLRALKTRSGNERTRCEQRAALLREAVGQIRALESANRRLVDECARLRCASGV